MIPVSYTHLYTITALIFKNPLPAAPILFLHIIDSNMLTMKNDIYYMRPFSIMVRFPGRFFETHVAKMSNINPREPLRLPGEIPFPRAVWL